MQPSFFRYLIRAAPFNVLKIISGVPLIIAYYHAVSDAKIPHLAYLYNYKNSQQFSDDLDFLTKNYKPIELKEVLRWLHEPRALTDSHFLLTFDDGFREIYEVVAPMLYRKGIPAVFFLNTAFIDNKELCFEHKASLIAAELEKKLPDSWKTEIGKILSCSGCDDPEIRQAVLQIVYPQRHLLDQIAGIIGLDFSEYLSRQRPYLTSEQIKELVSRGFFVGAHSIDHPRYAMLSEGGKLRQTVESVKETRQRFGLDYGVFAFPHSDSNISSKLLAAVHQSGIVDATFGNQGMLGESFPHHLQRFSLEKPVRPAREIIAMNYSRRIYKMITGRGTVQRPAF